MAGPDNGYGDGRHAFFSELAAGHALNALDPDEERQFLAHAADCPRCQRELASYAEVTEALAGTAPAAAPAAGLAGRILDATREPQAVPRPAVGPPPGPAIPRRQPGIHRGSPRGSRVRLAVAAAALAAAAAGIWGGLAATGGGLPAAGPACPTARACTEVALATAAGHGTAAEVIVSGRSVWLRPSRLPADNRASHIYVLWQITGTRTPLAVGSFDVYPGKHAAIRIGLLAVPYQRTWGFAVSLEHGRTIPAAPSHPVALGRVFA
jgi:hypothetical protein